MTVFHPSYFLGLSSLVRSPYDFKLVLLGSDPDATGGGGPGWFLGMGRTKIFR